jgi:putative flippase GtrA
VTVTTASLFTRSFWRARLHRKRIAFAITGAISVTLSLAMFRIALAAGASPHVATLARLALAMPILYIGYSRYMLGDALHADRAAHGRWAAELRMIAFVAVAIATSVLLKLAIEPVLTKVLLASGGHGTAMFAPLAGDLVYGPLATYLLLTRAPGRTTDAGQLAGGR